jgi:hypothetical protein
MSIKKGSIGLIVSISNELFKVNKIENNLLYCSLLKNPIDTQICTIGEFWVIN